jgi:hypothetical protein
MRFSASIPNIKIGYMVNDKLALLAMLPGATYKNQNKDRGFEGIMIAGQYWVQNHWWLMGGAGMTFDAPAFYTVKDLKTAKFYTGVPAFMFATGYELWNQGKFALDLRYQFFLGKSNLEDGKSREGFANMVVLGFNWY